MKVVTLNVRKNLNRWDERRDLIVRELHDASPDLIALQEVVIPIHQADILADALNHDRSGPPYRAYVAPKAGFPEQEGLAIITTLPVLEHNRLELPEGHRVAQLVTVESDGGGYEIVNTHLHHEPRDDESIRMLQARFILRWWNTRDKWYTKEIGPCSRVLIGDFNATPASETIRYVERFFASAYRANHGIEPPLTHPTPLWTERRDSEAPGTIDYIFFDPSTCEVDAAYLMFTHPAPEDSGLFASDHFGVLAELMRT